MDHNRSKQPVGYYAITADRKRRPSRQVGELHHRSQRRPGTHFKAPRLPDALESQCRSGTVSSPNVKAGGKACPIRFQCAGCGFYRPDPSFIPAIEEHINSLRLTVKPPQRWGPPRSSSTTSMPRSTPSGMFSGHAQRLDSLDPTERDRSKKPPQPYEGTRRRAAPARRTSPVRRRGTANDPDVSAHPARRLRESRRRDSDRKREKVFRTVDKMKLDGNRSTFASVARAASVSQWLVYADGVREYIEKPD